MKTRTILSVVALTFVINGYSDPIEVVSNNGLEVLESESVFDAGYAGSDDPFVGVQFTTGSAGDFEITSVSLNLGSHVETNGFLNLFIYSDSGNAPGTELVAFTAQASPGSGIVQFDPLSVLGVDNDTSYWLVASAVGAGSDYGWNYTDSTNSAVTGGLGWTIGDAVTLRTDFTIVERHVDSSQMFGINVTGQIPEPASLSLIVLMGGGFIFVKRRFK